jgi:hypothetical protein
MAVRMGLQDTKFDGSKEVTDDLLALMTKTAPSSLYYPQEVCKENVRPRKGSIPGILAEFEKYFNFCFNIKFSTDKQELEDVRQECNYKNSFKR